jgi:hypothetical protein
MIEIYTLLVQFQVAIISINVQSSSAADDSSSVTADIDSSAMSFTTLSISG